MDKYITETFKADLEALVKGEHDDWRGDTFNALAGVIVLDQLSRNMFRGSKQTWEADAQALAWARKMLEDKMDEQLPFIMRSFLGMPFEHSESLADQEESVRLFAGWAKEAKALPEPNPELSKILDDYTRYAVMHRDVVLKWGRFPHRNTVLGRPNTEEETRGLADGSIMKFG